MKKIFPMICIVIALVGLAGLLIYSTSPKEENENNTVVSLEALEQEVMEVSSSLLRLKYNKQWCKDNLTEYQTIAEYKGIQYFCNDKDKEIEQLKNRLAAMLTMQYEQLDANLNEWMQVRDTQLLANGTGEAIDRLMSFLQSE